MNSGGIRFGRPPLMSMHTSSQRPRISVWPSLARRSWKRRSIASFPSPDVSQVPSTSASPSNDGSRYS